MTIGIHSQKKSIALRSWTLFMHRMTRPTNMWVTPRTMEVFIFMEFIKTL